MATDRPGPSGTTPDRGVPGPTPEPAPGPPAARGVPDPAPAPPPRPAMSDRTPPPRPAMSDRTPPPLTPADVAPPSAVNLSRTVWVLSFLTGLTTVFFAFLGREKHLSAIAEQIRALDPGRATGTVETASQVVLVVTCAAVVLVILLEWLLVRRMVARRPGARLGLTVLLVLQAVVALVAEAFLTEPGGAGLRDRLVLLAWVALAALAYVVSLAPGVGRWLRSR